MTTSQHAFAAAHYSERAQDYVASVVHSTGDDLDQIETLLRGQDSARVLDLGCGGGHVSYRAAPHVAEVVACDVTASMLDAVAATAADRGLSNITLQRAPAEDLPFADASFDIVLCRFTAHHWQDIDAGLREACRVLKPNGRAVFIDTIAPMDRVLDTYLQAVEVLRDASHVRNYNIAEFTSALSRARFAITNVTVRRLRMDFPVWIARTRTSPLHAEAIRSLQSAAPPVVNDHFRVAQDGSFYIDTATFVVESGRGAEWGALPHPTITEAGAPNPGVR